MTARRIRNGISLLEVIVVTGMTSFVLVTTTVLLLSMMRSDRGLRQDVEFVTTFSRFSKNLRMDAHSATDAQLSPDGGENQQLLLTTADGQTIEYATSADGIERRTMENNRIVHRDQFRLPEEMNVNWMIHSNSAQTRVIAELSVTSDSTDGAVISAPLRLESVVGLRLSSHSSALREASP